jgi:RNA polymerase sigma-70 factor (ECF subfamily)
VPEREAELVRLCLEGDERALRALVERFQSAVFGLCYRMLGHREDAEDVAQEVFLRAFRSLTTYDITRPLRPWLLAIAANRCRTALEQRPRRPIAAEFLDHVPDASAPDAGGDWAEELQQALEQVRDDYRACFVLYYQQELSIAEIGEILNCPPGTVKTWLHRARKEIAARLIQRGFGPEAQHELRGI